MSESVGGERDLEARLVQLLSMVNDWLKYAEAKNSLVVGLASAGLVTSLATLPKLIEGSERHSLSLLLLIAGEIALVTSLISSLASFMPRTDLARWVLDHEGKPDGGDNLFYYGHLAKYKPEQLAATLTRRYQPRSARSRVDEQDLSESVVELAEQVVTNARITLWKLRLFVPALITFVCGVVLLTLAVLNAIV
jgi:hypothetical protein